jgi:hypothetical protein
MSVTATIRTVALLTPRLRDAMFEVLDACFENTDRQRFERDLAGKQWLILVEDGGQVAGFSTARIIELRLAEGRQRFLFSGDTVVAPAYWQQPALAAAFGHLALHLLDTSPTPLFWFLISKGFRTYCLLTANFCEFIPDCRHRDTARLQASLDAVARHMFGDRYDQARGIITAGPLSDFLRPELQIIPEGKRRNQHVRFFLERNPGWPHGDELACLAPLTRDNLTPLARRQIERTRPHWQL